MSGTGPSGNDTPTGGGATTPDCASLTGRGTIMSPDPAVLPLLSVGEMLGIELRTVTGPLQAFTSAGQLVGSVFLPGNLSAAFISCMNDGYEYEGRITSLTGGLCELLITAK